MKKKLFVISLIVICISIMASGTIAFFTAKDESKNVFTSGGVSVEVQEWQMVEGETEPQPYPTQAPIKIMPGDVVSKMPTVMSAAEDAYVRVSVAVEVLDANQTKIELSDAEIDAIIDINYNTTEWTVADPDDGYYYYKDAIGGGKATEALFTEVKFATSMDNRFQNCTVNVVVNAQAVQAKNNGTNVLDCAWN